MCVSQVWFYRHLAYKNQRKLADFCRSLFLCSNFGKKLKNQVKMKIVINFDLLKEFFQCDWTYKEPPLFSTDRYLSKLIFSAYFDVGTQQLNHPYIYSMVAATKPLQEQQTQLYTQVLCDFVMIAAELSPYLPSIIFLHLWPHAFNHHENL